MKLKLPKKLVLLLPLLLSGWNLFAQTAAISDTFRVSLENNYEISSLNIIPFSEIILINNSPLGKNEYTISYRKGSFSLNDITRYNIGDTLIIRYSSTAVSLKKEYRRQVPVFRYDKNAKDTLIVVEPLSRALSAESIFGRDINKSGSIIRGFTIGTNRDFTLNSGLRLQLSGKLSDDLELIAALTDENTPIQPEGNTQTLDEIDKVFIELRHRNFTGTFGDIDFFDNSSQFSRVTKKLQGLKTEIRSNDGNVIGSLVIAGARGKFNSLDFFGSDGNQGPYRLTGQNNERNIIIIAGSEKVFLDGIEMTRGENYDYIIDYSNATITFTPKRIITSASRIHVDYEYTDLNYSRNFMGVNIRSKAFDDRLSLGISYYREADNQDSPVELSLTDDDLNILKNAGDSGTDAFKSGVRLAEPDSAGNVKGLYSKRDTVINGQHYEYYLYAPGSGSSEYNVSFSYVGEAKGDYIKKGLGNYRFVGPGKGNYTPLIFLPLPELKQITVLSAAADLGKDVNFKMEFSGSGYDKNRFSSLDDNDNYGFARLLKLEIKPRDMKLFDINLGNIGLNFKERFIDSRYTTLDRINEVEFNRYYNLESDQKGNQLLREAEITYKPGGRIALNSSYGFLKQGANFESNRFFSRASITDEQNYNIDYTLDYVSSRNGSLNSAWNRQNGNAFYKIYNFRPGFDLLYEKKEEQVSDSLINSSYEYREAAPYIEFISGGFNIKGGYSVREEFAARNNRLIKQSEADIKQLSLEFNGATLLISSLTLSLRKKKYTDEFLSEGFTDSETFLLLSKNRFNFFDRAVSGDVYYQVSTEQSAKYEKVFVKVNTGYGNYIYLGDLNNNGIADENEFELTSYDGEFILITVPTEEQFPVIDLKSNVRFRIDFSKFKDGVLGKYLKPVSTETNWRVDENSRDKNTANIYFFKLSEFLNDSTTINGTQLFQQDVDLFKNRSDFSIRFRFLERKSLNQYSNGIEKGYLKERSVRLRFRMLKELSNQTEYVNRVDNYAAPPITKRSRNILRDELSTNFSYKPARKIEVGFKITTGRSTDYYPEVPTIIDDNSQTIQFNYSFLNLGRLRIELERIEINSGANENNIPFEILKGNIVGKNYFCRTYFDYRITDYIQTTINYEARIYGKRRVIHSMRAEARAYF
ncbi:hypothetical protein MROS_2604 [Melioribacter roseus P3M-2]|uniref:Uncharacterized protein n=1 Tax=Melioribacter roseus (strain DSM 23840 / JCM 17771 / VKM B-2668 / P3M-2) TaxID=1191523 RepID=I6ZUX8_MELRP|nr:hypothetical protein [Melioribacter roseus]AFN75834.1 hypothetical protein MROS_2604 [Melioribacter roseus P3M-2]